MTEKNRKQRAIHFIEGDAPRSIDVTELSERGNLDFVDADGNVVQGHGVTTDFRFFGVPRDVRPADRDRYENMLKTKGYAKVPPAKDGKPQVRATGCAGADVWAIKREDFERIEAHEQAQIKEREAKLRESQDRAVKDAARGGPAKTRILSEEGPTRMEGLK